MKIIKKLYSSFLNFWVAVKNIIKSKKFFWITLYDYVILHFNKKKKKAYQKFKLKDNNNDLYKMLSDDTPNLSKNEDFECAEFWKKYPVNYNKDWCRFYKSKTGIFDPKFIPSDIYYAYIDPYLNDYDAADVIDDKNYYPLLFNDVILPYTVVHIINGKCFDDTYVPICQSDAFDIIKKHKKLIFKKAVNSLGGHNIVVWDSNKEDEKVLKEYFDLALKEKNYVVQEFLTQSEELSSIYSGSVNTLRINTLILDNKVHFIAAILKMGAGKMIVDNVHWGGCSCGINEDGTLKKYGSDVNGNSITKHPDGFVFDGFKVPGFSEAKEMVCKLHGRLGRFRSVGWDIAINKNNEPVLIEVNLKYPAIEFQQWNNGPFFGDLTEAVLDEVYAKNNFKKGESLK